MIGSDARGGDIGDRRSGGFWTAGGRNGRFFRTGEIDLGAAEAGIVDKRGEIELGEGFGGWDFPGEIVVREVEVMEARLVEGRDLPCEEVVLETESVEPGDSGEDHWNGAGEEVAGENNDLETVDGGEGGRDPAGKAVVAEVEGLEVGERCEVGDGTREGVGLETEDTELVERSEDLRRQGAGEVEELEHKLGDPPIRSALPDSIPPIAKLRRGLSSPRDGVQGINGGLQSQKGLRIARFNSNGGNASKKETKQEEKEKQTPWSDGLRLHGGQYQQKSKETSKWYSMRQEVTLMD